MSDYNSSLPVRTENDGDIVIKVVDGTITSQKLTVNADGSVNITDNGGSLTVDGTVELGATSLAALESITVQNGSGGSAVNIQDGGNSITVDAVAFDIRALAFATDTVDASGSVVALDSASLAALESITVQNGAGGSAVNIQDGGNSITVDGTVELGATTLAALESITVSATALDIRALAFATDSVDVSGSSVNADIRVGGNAVSGSNPIPVQLAPGTPGTEIHNYQTSASVAAAASVNHDYTITALKTFKGEKFFISGSGKVKAEVQISPDGTNFSTKFVGFNSTSNPNIDIMLGQFTLTDSGTGSKVRIIITNLDKQAQDVYSTLSGVEV